jgi:hypothetical protein
MARSDDDRIDDEADAATAYCWSLLLVTTNEAFV